mmetsp:Transcript_17165/g.33653  ORF Transcript_17165/g.33653 Transcript_17165/m.33653 type:complete len:393 (+) Transcript_17165:84-1262(+)
MSSAPSRLFSQPSSFSQEEFEALAGGESPSRGTRKELQGRRRSSRDQGKRCRCTRTCCQRWIDRYLSTLRIQAFAFAVCLFVLQIYTAVVFFRMEVLSTLYLHLVTWPIFAPTVALGLYLVVLTLSLSKSPRRDVVRKLINVVLLILTVMVYAVFISSTQVLLNTGRTVRSVGRSASKQLTDEDAQKVNDLTAAMFQNCCVNRGWAFRSLARCSSVTNLTRDCPYYTLEGSCVCIIDEEYFEMLSIGMTSTYCTGITFTQDVPEYTVTLLGPPEQSIQGCGSSAQTGYLTGAPNQFQQLFSRYYSVLLTNTLSVNMTFVVVWIASQAFGYSIKFIRYIQIRRDQLSRSRRRKEISKKRSAIKDMQRVTSHWPEHLGFAGHGPRSPIGSVEPA